MPAITTRAAELSTAAEVFENARNVRARMRSLRAPQPVRPPEALRPDPAPVPRVAPPPVPSLVDQIIDTVCTALGATREALFCDVGSDQLATGRKVALGFVAMRVGTPADVLASHFAVLPAVVRDATRRVRNVLVEFALPFGAPLDKLVRVLLDNVDGVELSAPRVTVGTIKRAVCEEYGLTQLEIESDTRARAVVIPRMIGMALARRFSGRSLPFIGAHFGDRDHTTVLHACRRARPHVEMALATLPEGASLIEFIAAIRKDWEATDK